MQMNLPDPKARFDVANRMFLRLYQASNLLHKTGTKAVSAYGATTQQWAVLGALSRPGAREAGMTVKDLVRFLMVSRQNLSAVLDRLETAGHVERLRSEGMAACAMSASQWPGWRRGRRCRAISAPTTQQRLPISPPRRPSPSIACSTACATASLPSQRRVSEAGIDRSCRLR